MRNINVLIILALSFSMISCKKDMSDLDKYFADAKNIPAQPIEPLPVINPPEIFLYEAEDSRDPFSNDLQVLKEKTSKGIDDKEGPGPDRNRRKELLENYPLDSLTMVGTYLQGEDFWGLVEDPEGVIYFVSKDQYIGQNDGKITEVNEDQIYLSEWITDGLDGWTEREASIALREE